MNAAIVKRRRVRVHQVKHENCRDCWALAQSCIDALNTDGAEDWYEFRIGRHYALAGAEQTTP